MKIRRWLMVVLLALGALDGCLTERACPTESGASDDAGTDARVTGPLTDAGLDGGAAEDGSAASCAVPTQLYVGPLVSVESPTSAVGCSLDDGRMARVRIFQRGDPTPLLDREGPCASVLAIGRVVRGDYEMAIESDGFVVGASLIYPEHCSAADPTDDVFCNPIPLPLRGCGSLTVTAAIYCDPALRPCQEHAWPW
jgi:hypothetical protein